MACIQTENFYFAIRKDTGEPIHISHFSQLPDEEKGKYRGLKCNCICAACKRSLVAKMGEVKAPHFAHYVEKGTILDCSAQKANESGLHQMAKKIVKESTYINLPAIEIEAECDPSRNANDEKQCEPLHIKDEQMWYFSSAEMEVPCNGFTPDVYLHGEKTDLLVEIMVTHPVDDEKKERVKQAGLPMIEIDISDIYNNLEKFSEEMLRRELIDSVERKEWIYNRLKGEKSVGRLKARNRKREIEFQKGQPERLRKYQEERERETWREAIWLKNDKDYYLSYSTRLVNDRQALEEINKLGICNLKFLEIGSIPFYLNIPVFGEVAFNCDRRIWQSILFENFIYRRKDNSVLQPEKVYFYFGNVQRNWLNWKFVHFWKKKFPEKSLLRCALEEYMIHLSGLGFIDRAFYRDANVYREYPVRRCTLEPENTLYAEFLKQALAHIPPTNHPFDYLQDGWIKKCYELEQQGIRLE